MFFFYSFSSYLLRNYYRCITPTSCVGKFSSAQCKGQKITNTKDDNNNEYTAKFFFDKSRHYILSIVNNLVMDNCEIFCLIIYQNKSIVLDISLSQFFFLTSLLNSDMLTDLKKYYTILLRYYANTKNYNHIAWKIKHVLKNISTIKIYWF